jgi:hypothetical protein
MRYGRACLVIVLLVLCFAFGGTGARAASLDDAIAHFTAGDFDETIAGINEVAASGSPRAATILQALQNGQLTFSVEKKAVYIQDDASKLFDAVTGATGSRRPARRPRHGEYQQSHPRSDRRCAWWPHAPLRRSG